MNEIGMNELGMNEIGMNEIGMNEMPPREEQMTQTKNATTKKKRNSGRVRGVKTGQLVQESKGSQLQTSFLQLLHLNSSSDAPQKQTRSWRGTMPAQTFLNSLKFRGAAPN